MTGGILLVTGAASATGLTIARRPADTAGRLVPVTGGMLVGDGGHTP